MQSEYLGRRTPDGSLPDGVLQIGNNFFVGGGSDRYFFDISAALARAGVRVIPFAPRDERNETTPWSSYFPASLRTDRAGPGDVFRFIYSTAAKRSLKQLLRAERIQLAHLHIYYGRLTAAILPVLVNAGIPIVQTVHDFKLVCPVYSCLRNGRICEDCHGRSFWKAAVYRCNRGSAIRSFLSSTESYVSKSLGSHSSIDHYIAVSDFQKERLLANEVCTPDRITTIHNAVYPAAFDWDDSNGEYVCYFGRVEKLKGMQTLLEAMRRLPNVQLKIAGDGSYLPDCERYVRDNGLSNVEFCGRLSGPRLAEFVKHSLCSVLPTEAYENCPMSVLESLAYGRPVVGSRIGGIPELVEEGIDGILFSPGNVDELAGSIGRIAGNHALAVEMGRAGRKKIESRFNMDRHLEDVMRVYSKVLA